MFWLSYMFCIAVITKYFFLVLYSELYTYVSMGKPIILCLRVSLSCIFLRSYACTSKLRNQSLCSVLFSKRLNCERFFKLTLCLFTWKLFRIFFPTERRVHNLVQFYLQFALFSTPAKQYSPM